MNRRAFLAPIVVLGSRSAWAASDGAPDLWELPVPDMERLSPTVWVKQLVGGIWITCFTFKTPDLGYVPCNGLIIAAPPGPTIVDTGNTRDQGKLLVRTAKRLTGKSATQAIATHYHGDRTGGIAAMRDAKIPVFGHPYTVGLAQAYDLPMPQPVKGLEKGAVQLGPVELYYPGAGHTRDNITVWHQESRTLFGGCLLRATSDKGIGNREHADMGAYPGTIERLTEKYPDRQFIIPGHGTSAGDALTWTRSRLSAALARP
jgi:metallo-beta-lactamase class B